MPNKMLEMDQTYCTAFSKVPDSGEFKFLSKLLRFKSLANQFPVIIKKDREMRDVFLVLLGTFSGAILAWFQFKYIWINQKKLEAKLIILDEAAKALGFYQREALDPGIQSQKRKFETENGNVQVRAIELTAETDILIRKTLVKTKALFSEKTYDALNKALNAPLSVEDVSGHSHHNWAWF